MKNSENEHETMVEKHALSRLNKVEADHERVYKKKKRKISFNQIFMFVVMALILVIMVISMFRQ